MSRSNQFEACYQADKNYWGMSPSAVIEKWAPRFVPGTVLDVGAGDGRNSIYLATQNFQVVALDTAPTGLANLREKAWAAKVGERIQTIEADIIDFDLPEQYDNIITNFTLHFVGSRNIEPVLQKLIANTKPGGINVIDDFTQNGPLAEKHPEDYITASFLEHMYQKQGWMLLDSAVRPVKTKAFEAPGKPYTHEAIALVAQKPL